jgi:crossover junction endodeoxyribonuclease RuvC
MPSTTHGLILGIDPGLAGTGFAFFAEPDVVLSSSTVVTIPGRDGARLLTITNHLRALIAENPPAEASIEELFMGRNATSAVGVAQARGATLNVLEECGVPVFEYKPSQVKIILTGYGNADKAQIGRMLAAQVRLPEGRLDDHARDAIAIALCHSRSRRFARATISR